MTTFENRELPPADAALELSGVQKLTSMARLCVASENAVRAGETYYVSLDENSMGLPSVRSCPGSTEICEADCYAVESERRSATAERLQRNYDILEQAETSEAMAEKLEALIDAYRAQADRLGVPQEKRRFRFHWSGDIFSITYAQALATTITANPDIHFFMYTRTFTPEVNAVPELVDIENLDLFLSVDAENVDRAAEVAAEYPRVRISYLVDNYPEEAIPLIERMGRTEEAGFRKRFTCPENVKDEHGNRHLALVSERGGACSLCRYCSNGRKTWDVIFLKSSIENQPQQVLDFVREMPVSLRQRRSKPTTVATANSQHPRLF